MKYIIEIEDTPYTEPTSEIELYKATNFNSLVFDKTGLDKLEKFDSNEEYDRGYSQGIADCEKAIDTLGSFTLEELEEEFGTKVFTGILLENPLQDIIAITKAYKEKKKAEEETIKVGDVIYSKMSNVKAVVTSISERGDYDCIYSDGATFTLNVDKAAEYWTKVGHFDEVSQVLDKLRGEVQE